MPSFRLLVDALNPCAPPLSYTIEASHRRAAETRADALVSRQAERFGVSPLAMSWEIEEIA